MLVMMAMVDGMNPHSRQRQEGDLSEPPNTPKRNIHRGVELPGARAWRPRVSRSSSSPSALASASRCAASASRAADSLTAAASSTTKAFLRVPHPPTHQPFPGQLATANLASTKGEFIFPYDKIGGAQEGQKNFPRRQIDGNTKGQLGEENSRRQLQKWPTRRTKGGLELRGQLFGVHRSSHTHTRARTRTHSLTHARMDACTRTRTHTHPYNSRKKGLERVRP